MYEEASRSRAPVPWLSRADRAAYIAGGGRLLTRVYSLPVNYRSGRRLVPIQAHSAAGRWRVWSSGHVDKSVQLAAT